MAKERLDILLVERGLAGSRERAKRMIMAGEVLVDGQKIDKAGTTVKPEAEIRLLGRSTPSMSATASWPGSCARTSASSIWSARTSARSRRR